MIRRGMERTMGMKAFIGDSLILLPAACTICLSVFMLRRIRAAVLKAPYAKIFCCEEEE